MRRALRWTVVGVAVTLLCAGAVAYVLRRPSIAFVPAPAGAVPGVPERPLRFVSYNILHNQRGRDAVVAEILRLQPDFVFLQELESRDISFTAKALKMRHVYYPSVNLAGNTSWGNAIYSKYPLYEAESIPNPGGGSFGLWAYAVIDDRKFCIACVHLSATWNAKPSHLIESGNNRNKELTNLLNAWQIAGKPPMIVGGDFNQIPWGNNYSLMRRDLADALAQLGRTDNTFKDGLLRTRIDYFLVSPEWRATDGGVVSSEASDHRPIWAQIGPGH